MSAQVSRPPLATVNSWSYTVSALWLPMSLVAGYLCVLRLWFNQMQAHNLGGGDPFKTTSTYPALFGSALYLAFVYLGKRFMSARKAFEVKEYMFTYNLYQVLLNLWTVIGFIKEVSGFGDAEGMTFWGNTFDPTPAGFKLGFLVWIHYNNKFVELLDTAWMVMRKKDRQISFLHMYHHVLMMWAWLIVCKVECGGDAWFGACVNSFVHVIMYSYYLFTQMGIRCPWKKYLTLVQMAQFVVCMAHAGYVAYRGNAPLELPLVQAFVMLNMLVLFGNFYRSAYTKQAQA